MSVASPGRSSSAPSPARLASSQSSHQRRSSGSSGSAKSASSRAVDRERRGQRRGRPAPRQPDDSRSGKRPIRGSAGSVRCSAAVGGRTVRPPAASAVVYVLHQERRPGPRPTSWHELRPGGGSPPAVTNRRVVRARSSPAEMRGSWPVNQGRRGRSAETAVPGRTGSPAAAAAARRSAPDHGMRAPRDEAVAADQHPHRRGEGRRRPLLGRWSPWTRRWRTGSRLAAPRTPASTPPMASGSKPGKPKKLTSVPIRPWNVGQHARRVRRGVGVEARRRRHGEIDDGRRVAQEQPPAHRDDQVSPAQCRAGGAPGRRGRVPAGQSAMPTMSSTRLAVGRVSPGARTAAWGCSRWRPGCCASAARPAAGCSARPGRHRRRRRSVSSAMTRCRPAAPTPGSSHSAKAASTSRHTGRSSPTQASGGASGCAGSRPRDRGPAPGSACRGVVRGRVECGHDPGGQRVQVDRGAGRLDRRCGRGRAAASGDQRLRRPAVRWMPNRPRRPPRAAAASRHLGRPGGAATPLASSSDALRRTARAGWSWLRRSPAGARRLRAVGCERSPGSRRPAPRPARPAPAARPRPARRVRRSWPAAGRTAWPAPTPSWVAAAAAAAGVLAAASAGPGGDRGAAGGAVRPGPDAARAGRRPRTPGRQRSVDRRWPARPRCRRSVTTRPSAGPEQPQLLAAGRRATGAATATGRRRQPENEVADPLRGPRPARPGWLGGVGHELVLQSDAELQAEPGDAAVPRVAVEAGRPRCVAESASSRQHVPYCGSPTIGRPASSVAGVRSPARSAPTSAGRAASSSRVGRAERPAHLQLRRAGMRG